MTDLNLPPEFIEKLKQIRSKRARLVIDHIFHHGEITTEDLEGYGYKHPPRALQDVKDEGIPIKRFRVKSADGTKTIAVYRFGDLTQVRSGRAGGRRSFPKSFKAALYHQSDGRCAICNGEFQNRELQIDHRVPYDIAGDAPFSDIDTDAYMLLCASCNRAKSWSCEHCPNWSARDETVCKGCYWAYPTSYHHVATREVRRMDMVWSKDEIALFDDLKSSAELSDESLPDHVKKLLKYILDNTS